MALTWNYDVKDLAAIGIGEDGDDNEWVISEVLIWASMGVGLGRITEKNWMDFYARLKFYESLSGSFIVGHDITPEDVYKRIGLSTNVSDETEHKFITRIAKNRLADLKYQAEKAVEKQAVPA
jgi:hypothetical protein